ncbi:hypothetical protein LTS18_004434 [Coniosporium uncinatum]|uniref:Uncharacterized protein n=1 Tax=Coniosporium uncinatum TaxID=93489 RepID=A0ACC3DBG0_9PEZI|nr:hypothetical protein LTS18_004434 [Coniosporium uncinatum]
MTAKLMSAERAPMGNGVRDSIRSLILDLSTFADQRPDTCGTSRWPTTATMQKIWLKQALPTLMNGRHAIAVLGSWTTVADFKDQVGYWTGSSESVQVQKDMWSRLFAWDSRKQE